MKLGKLAVRHDPRTLKLARYIGALPPPPPVIDWALGIGPLGQMMNDSLGNCTCAAIGHMVQAWTGSVLPTAIIPPDSSILALYEQACGYNPADPSTDQGGVEIDVLNFVRKNGIPGFGHKIGAYAAANVQDQNEIMSALNLFGGIYAGVQLPISAQTQVGGIWDVSDINGNVGGWGGHAVPIVAADADGLTCVTWGAKQRMTWAFWRAYFDEAYAILAPDWFNMIGEAPSGFDLAQLQADLALIVA